MPAAFIENTGPRDDGRTALHDAVLVMAVMVLLHSAFRRRRDVREVDPEVISPAELALVPPVDEVPSSLEEADAVEVEVAPAIAVAAPELDEPTEESIPEPVDESPASELEPEAEPPLPAPLEDLTCEILFWRGYRKATFYARIFSDDGEPLAVAHSPSFRSRGNGAPDQSEEAVAAYQALREQLEQWGWQHVGSGDAWFDDVFTRPL